MYFSHSKDNPTKKSKFVSNWDYVGFIQIAPKVIATELARLLPSKNFLPDMTLYPRSWQIEAGWKISAFKVDMTTQSASQADNS